MQERSGAEEKKVSFKQVVEQFYGELTSADKDLIQEIFENPQDVAFLTAAELAARAGVHESTAIRLAKKLGYQGYRDLRKNLQADLLDTVESSERIQRSLARAGNLESLVTDEIAALHEVLQTVSQDQIDAAAKILINAENVYIFARGHATSLVEYTDRRLRRAGFDTVDLRSRRRDMAEHLVNMNPKDALLAFAFRKQQPGLEALLSQTQAEGIPSIMISDSLGPVFRPKPTVLIWARRGTEGEFQSHSVPMTIISAIILSIARLDNNRTFKSLEKLEALIRRYGKPDSA